MIERRNTDDSEYNRFTRDSVNPHVAASIGLRDWTELGGRRIEKRTPKQHFSLTRSMPMVMG